MKTVLNVILKCKQYLLLTEKLKYDLNCSHVDKKKKNTLTGKLSWRVTLTPSLTLT